MQRITVAGLPATTAPAATSLVTTLPAPITVRSPIVTPGQMIDPPPIQTSSPIVTGLPNSCVRRRSASNRFARKLGRKTLKLTLANVQQLQRYTWPGNIRELQHVLERTVIIAADGKLRFELPEDTPTQAAQKSQQLVSPTQDSVLTDREVRDFEAENIRRALAASNGKIYGDGGAAERLGLKPTTLMSRIRAFGIKSQ